MRTRASVVATLDLSDLIRPRQHGIANMAANLVAHFIINFLGREDLVSLQLTP